MGLTIVTVVKDDPDGLRFTLSSIQRQTGRARFLIMDGGSREATHDVLHQWSSTLDMEVESATDSGPYDAMNRALVKLDASDLVWFINSGDALIGDDALVVAERLTHGIDFSWGFGPHQVIEASGEPRRVVRGQPFSLANFAYGRTPICHQAVIARVSCLRAVGGFDPVYPIVADYKSLLLLGKRWTPMQWNDVLVQYRAGGLSDRNLSQTIQEQGRARREVLAPHGLSRFRDRAHDVRRQGKRLARAAIGGLGIEQRHFEVLRRSGPKSATDVRA